MTAIRITRRPAPVCLEGVYIAGLGDLRVVLPGDGADAHYAVSDLSLGAWIGHQVARDFALQLGLTPHLHARPPVETAAAQEDLAGHSDAIGRLIDAESSGDTVVLTALDLAGQLLAAVAAGRPTAFVVLAPRFGHPWERENEIFVEFLLRGLAGSPSRLILACADAQPPALPARWSVAWANEPRRAVAAVPPAGLWTLVPGLLARDLADRLLAPSQAGSSGAGPHPPSPSPIAMGEGEPPPSSPVAARDKRSAEGGLGRRDEGLPAKSSITPGTAAYLRLAGGHILVGPECRRDPALVPGTEYERLAEQAAPCGWLLAYACLRGANHPAASAALRDEAGRRFAEGGHAIALRLLEHAVLCAQDPLEQAAALLQLQSMRIALMRFGEAAQAPDTPAQLPAGLRGVLLQCKAWGLAMTGRSAQAEPYFQQARELLRDYEQSRFYLYLLNISALNKLRLDLPEEALALEKTIERQLAAAQQPDWHLTYINSINQARLYRIMREFELAERYYRRAFATNEGLRSDSDLVYINVCLAHLNERRSLQGAAFANWLRAALYYVSAPAPEALAPRVARAIVEHDPPAPALLPEAIAQALMARLETTARAAAIGLSVFERLDAQAPLPEGLPVFARTDDAPAGCIEYAFGSPGWSLMGMTGPALQPAYAGPQYDRLRALLVGLAVELCPALAAAPITSLLVDTGCGSEMPDQPDELLYACVRLRVPLISFAGKQVSLNADAIRALERDALVRIGNGPGYARYAGANLRIHFKRYLEPVTLDEKQSRILQLVDTGKTVADVLDLCADLGPTDAILAELRTLERLRLLVIGPPDQLH